MEPSFLRWILDEQALADLVGRFPTLGLVVLIAAAILVLSKGADWMIEGAAHLARRTGLPKIGAEGEWLAIKASNNRNAFVAGQYVQLKP